MAHLPDATPLAASQPDREMTRGSVDDPVAPIRANDSAWRRFARNRGAVAGLLVLIALVVLAVFADLLYPGDPLRIVAAPETWPFQSWQYPLGTDALGRDIASEIVHGARATLLIGLVSALGALVIGVSLGVVAGWCGGWIDAIAMRFAELFQIIPNVVFVLTVVALLGPKIGNITIAVALVSWPPIARLTRGECIALKHRDFVDASRTAGLSGFQIATREVLPNALPPVLVLGALVVAGAILYESVVSFLGLGDPNIASWGRMVGEGRSLIRESWYLCAIPGVAIVLAVLALNLVGDGLNDAWNPKRGRR